MFNLALGWAFLISYFASPGGKLFVAVIDPAALRSGPAYQGAIAGVFANYWVPALLIYLVLLAVRAERFLKPGAGIHWMFGVSSAVLSLYAVLRVFTSTIEGGGASFVLASFARYVTVPALVLLGIATLWLVIRSVQHRADPVPPDRVSSLRSAGGIAAMLFLLPPFAYFGWLYASHAEQIAKLDAARHAKFSRLDELCKTAVKAEIRRAVPRAKSVLFQLIDNATYPVLQELEFVELRNTYAKPGEPAYRRLTRKPGEPVFVDRKLNINNEPVAEATAEYEVSIRLLETKAEAEQGVAIEERKITDRRSGEVVAVFVSVSERNAPFRTEPRFCGAGERYAQYQIDSTSFALGLMEPSRAKAYEKRLTSSASAR
jgi:hypothetical protein